MRTVLTKAEFAQRKGRSPSALSHWIAEGKITPSALIGKGVRAKIWLEQAERDLEASLDLGQQLAQQEPAIPLLNREDRPAASPSYSERERAARATKAEEDALTAQLRNAREEGRWIDAHQAQLAWSRRLAGVFADLDSFLTGPLARELAEAHRLDFKALAVEIRDIARRHRTKIADQAADERSTLLAAAP